MKNVAQMRSIVLSKYLLFQKGGSSMSIFVPHPTNKYFVPQHISEHFDQHLSLEHFM